MVLRYLCREGSKQHRSAQKLKVDGGPAAAALPLPVKLIIYPYLGTVYGSTQPDGTRELHHNLTRT